MSRSAAFFGNPSLDPEEIQKADAKIEAERKKTLDESAKEAKNKRPNPVGGGT